MKFLKLTTLVGTLVLVFALSVFSDDGGGGSPDPYDKVIPYWYPEAEHLARIVPPHYIRPDYDPTTSEIQMDPEELQVVLKGVERALREGRASTRCAPSIESTRYEALQGVTDLPIAQTIQAREVVIRGIVEKAVPSWDLDGRVVQLVFVKVSEVLKDIGGSVRAGDLVTFEQHFGTVEILGVTFCNVTPEFVFKAVQGVEIVLGGEIYPTAVNHLMSLDIDVFEVKNGQIENDRYPYFGGSSISVQYLRQVMAE